MPPDENSPLVSTEWLASHLNDEDVRIVDVRWRSRYVNGRGISFDNRDGYMEGHIPGAVFAAMAGELSDPDHPVPDMLLPPQRFAAAMGRLGISDDTMVVTYDDMGLPLGSARLWWALSYYGHKQVKVLDGGLRQWQNEGHPVSTDIPSIEPATFTTRLQTGWIAEKQDVVAALDQPDTLIIDCLANDQYSGAAGEDHWGARPGHIPGAVNVPSIANIDPTLARASSEERQRLLQDRGTYTFAPKNVLERLYGEAGLSKERQVIAYCGRGFAASCGVLALKALGHEKVKLYDGSWSEWSADTELPVEVGNGTDYWRRFSS